MKMEISKQAIPRWLCHDPDHRKFKDGEFWKAIPGWKDVSVLEFGNYLWQMRNSITSIGKIKDALQHRISDRLLADFQLATEIVPMNIRITPYIFSLIDWDNPVEDPLRREFLPIGSQMLDNHPFHLKDSLYEDVDSPVQYLTHRYPDKVLFLTLSICPHYCSYCTRSRLIGGSTKSRDKQIYSPDLNKYEAIFQYIREHEQIEDVVVSGGDASLLRPDLIRLIGTTLLDIGHIRRIRYATKSLAVFPMKILSDDDWFRALIDMSELGRKRGKHVCIHTHFSSPREISDWSRRAADRFFQAGMTVRNQAVFQAGVNNDPTVMGLFIRQLSHMNVQPYYVFILDMVPGIEHLRTTLRDAVEMEKTMRGLTAGFNIPTFTCDLPTGGGKRHIASYEHYNEESGISVWRSPTVKPGKVFFYFDPIQRLSPEFQTRWQDTGERKRMLEDALAHVSPKLTPDLFYGLQN
jgi:lysine 2,3-aminomutase